MQKQIGHLYWARQKHNFQNASTKFILKTAKVLQKPIKQIIFF